MPSSMTPAESTRARHYIARFMLASVTLTTPPSRMSMPLTGLNRLGIAVSLRPTRFCLRFILSGYQSSTQDSLPVERLPPYRTETFTYQNRQVSLGALTFGIADVSMSLATRWRIDVAAPLHDSTCLSDIMN